MISKDDYCGNFNKQPHKLISMKFLTSLLLFLTAISVFASNARYRVMFRTDPSTSATIGWDQTSGSNPVVHYDVVDHGTNASAYAFSKSVDRSASYKGMNNTFAHLTNLQPNTAYYFVIQDSQGTSQRFWFKTTPNTSSERLSFIAGGDSRNNATPRRNANKLVSKLHPHAVFFGGDMTNGDSNSEWLEWMNDWQLTTSADGRMIPIVAARGNHEGSNNSIYHLFDVPSTNVYYALTFGGNLIRAYTLNSEISISGSQTSWLNSDFASHTNVVWKMAQYHKPMRPHVSSKSEGNSQYSSWANPFYQNNVKLVIECDAHTVKTTWPVVPSTGSGNDEGFIRDDANGTVYAGEGCWGAPLRSNNDAKSWTRASGQFNQFKWIFVDNSKIEVRTVKVDNADQVGQINDNDVFTAPSNLDIWNPSNGSVVTIQNQGGNVSPTVNITSPSNNTNYPNAQTITVNATASDADGSISKVEFLVDGVLKATDSSFPYAASLSIANGSSTIVAKAYDNEGATSTTSITVSAGAFSETLESRINASMDDVEQNANGSIYTNSSDIELVADGSKGNQTIGLRFNNINIPQGATIDKAYIQFTTDETNSGTTSLTIKGEDVNNASAFTTSTNNVSNRTKTSASTSWNPSSWSSVGASTTNERTPELKAIVQEIIDRSGWVANNSMAMVITGTGERTAESYDGTSSSAPLLHIEYTVGNSQGGTNQAPSVSISSPSNGANITENVGNTLTISATASDADGSVSSVEFYRNGSLIGTDNSSPYSVNWTISAEGIHSFTAKAIDNEGAETTSSSVSVTITEPSTGGTVSETLDVRVATGNDDAEEAESGAMYLNSSDLELVYDSYNSAGNQQVGMRFTGISIPQGATITNAYLVFTADEVRTGSSAVTIYGEDVNDASGFSTSSNNISNRTKTSASAAWSILNWNTVGETHQSPEVKSIVQEVVNRSGWSAGNDMVFIVTGSGRRAAESYNGSSSKAPLLHVEYEYTTENRVLSTTEVSSDNIAVYPNPVLNWVNVSNGNNENVTAVVYSQTGATITSIEIEANQTKQVNVQDLEAGVYIVVVNNEKYTFVKK